ncbi:MAG TPA: hypothetical protein VGU03_13470 [Frateuria sp.]|uniref:hypothetical protein n=1 Tax=Frateuria sp. TaxID=2211372 RepID=UPI002DF4FEEC|nr:hypothetical protein [Frateuria sp.]
MFADRPTQRAQVGLRQWLAEPILAQGAPLADGLRRVGPPAWVDIVEWANASEAFRRLIAREHRAPQHLPA